VVANPFWPELEPRDGTEVIKLKMTNWDRARRSIEHTLNAWVEIQLKGEEEPNWYPDTWDLVFQIRHLLKDD